MKPTRNAKAKAPRPFGKTPRVPRQIESAAHLWLDFFDSYSLALISELDSHQPYGLTLERAAGMADKALELFQDKWPKVYT